MLKAAFPRGKGGLYIARRVRKRAIKFYIAESSEQSGCCAMQGETAYKQRPSVCRYGVGVAVLVVSVAIEPKDCVGAPHFKQGSSEL